MAGYVEAIGKGVSQFKKGDRVAGVHEMMTPGGAFAEHGIVKSFAAFRIPDETSFEEVCWPAPSAE